MNPGAPRLVRVAIALPATARSCRPPSDQAVVGAVRRGAIGRANPTTA
jgi:hypothetical protein